MPVNLDEFWWATGGSAEITEPPDARKNVGFVSGDVPPHQYINWTWNILGELIDATQGSVNYSTLSSAVTALTDLLGNPIERTCIIDEYDLDQSPGTINTSIDTGTNTYCLDVSGNAVVYIEDGAAAGYAKNRGLTSTLATYTKTNAGSATKIITDGKYTAIAYAGYVELFTFAGVSSWVYNNTNTIIDICMDGTRLYLVDSTGLAKAINLAAGTLTWSYNHGAALYHCATNGKQVFIGGAVSSYASSATLRALVATNGYDEANEGGTGLDATDVAWNKTPTLSLGIVVPSLYQKIVCDGRNLYIFDVSTNTLEVRSCANGNVSVSRSLSDYVLRMAVDQDFLVVSNDADQVITFDKKTLNPIWLWKNTVDTWAVASDGAAVFAASLTGTRTITRLYRGNRSGIWRRADLADNYLPYRQLIIPME
jgi:hypothetical protein